LLGAALGIPFGVVSAMHHNRWPDFALRLLSVTGIAVAAFWFAITLQLVFAMNLEWLPLRGELSSGVVPPPAITGSLVLDALLAGRWDIAGDSLKHLVLPVVTLAVGPLATITRFTRRQQPVNLRRAGKEVRMVIRTRPFAAHCLAEVDRLTQCNEYSRRGRRERVGGDF
jgi:ABC-type dipeptide/oligopeptide/nickel transport system permease component